MTISENAEETMFSIYREYSARLKKKIPDEDARVFSFPLPGDPFLHGMYSVEEELQQLGMIAVSGKQYTLTRSGIKYCREFDAANLAFHAAQSAQKDAVFSRKMAILSALLAFASLLVTIIAEIIVPVFLE